MSGINNYNEFDPFGPIGGYATVQFGTSRTFNPVVGIDHINYQGSSCSIKIKHQCITVMPEYEKKSLEELRFEDYKADRRGLQRPAAGFCRTNEQPIFEQTMFGGTVSCNGGTYTKFSPVTGTDLSVIHGVMSCIRYQCISVMQEYEGKSLEELRFGDYLVGRKGPQPTWTNRFGTNQSSTFGNNTMLQESTKSSQNQTNPMFDVPNAFGNKTSSGNAFVQPRSQKQQTFEFGSGLSRFIAPKQSFFNSPSRTEMSIFGGSATTQQNPSGFFGLPISTPRALESPTTSQPFPPNFPFGENRANRTDLNILQPPRFGFKPPPNSGLFGPVSKFTQPTTKSSVSSFFPTTSSTGLFGSTNNANRSYNSSVSSDSTARSFGFSSTFALSPVVKPCTGNNLSNSISSPSTRTATFSSQPKTFDDEVEINGGTDIEVIFNDLSHSSRTSGLRRVSSDDLLTQRSVEAIERSPESISSICLNSGTGFKGTTNPSDGKNNPLYLSSGKNKSSNNSASQSDHNYAQTAGVNEKKNDRLKIDELERKCEELTNQVMCLREVLQITSAVTCPLRERAKKNNCDTPTQQCEDILSSLQSVLRDFCEQQVGMPAEVPPLPAPRSQISTETQTEDILISSVKSNAEAEESEETTQSAGMISELINNNEQSEEISTFDVGVNITNESKKEDINEPMESEIAHSPSKTNKPKID